MKNNSFLMTIAILSIAVSVEAQINSVFKDSRDGVIYNTVKIGTQTWMVENLKATNFNDGTSIPLVTDSTSWFNLKTPGYCWYNDDELKYKNLYGPLYNWYAVNTGKLCPAGWHVPSDGEWTKLTDYLGGESIAGWKMQEAGTNHWEGPNEKATNESGFTALPGGGRSKGTLNRVGSFGIWWSTSESNEINAFGLILNQHIGLRRYGGYKSDGFSVRCLKD